MKIKKFNPYFGFNTFADFLLSCKFFFMSNYTDNKIINEYSDRLSSVTDCKYVLTYGSGRMALYSILESLEIKKDDEIIIPAYTCAVVANAIIYAGAKPIYADINLSDFNINTNDIISKITNKTKALYVQHTFGNICDFEKINNIAEQNNLYVIEDAAHSLGAKINNKKIGSLTTISFFSTDHSKTINTQLGGFVGTNNTNLYLKLSNKYTKLPFLNNIIIKRIIISFIFEYIFFSKYLYFIGKYLYLILIKFKLIFYFDDIYKVQKPLDYPYPCKLSSFQAALGINELKRLDKNLQIRRIKYNIINKLINENENLKTDYSPLRFSFLVNNRNKIESQFYNYDLGIWFKSVLEGRYQDFNHVNYIKGSCINAEYATSHIINFPIHARIDINHLQKIIKKNLSLIKENRVKNESI